MKLISWLGKLLMAVFWLAVLANLLRPFAYPFDLLLSLAGALMVILHVLQLLLSIGRLGARAHPWRDRLQILLFGAFHLLRVHRDQRALSAS